MHFRRIETSLMLALSLFGLSGAHSIHPRAIPATPSRPPAPQSHPTSSPRAIALQAVRSNTTRAKPVQAVPSKTIVQHSSNNTGSGTAGPPEYSPDHPEWGYLNGITWWKFEPTQQDHLRFHALLSMAAYGNYADLCPKTFTQGFTVLQAFNTTAGQAGFIAMIPEMEKVVIVFRGYDKFEDLDWSPVSIEDLDSKCVGCTAAAGAKKLYLSAKKATNNWAVAINKVKEKKLRFSVTGHGVGGAVAALAAIELGSQSLVHYSHNQGMPRSLNYAATVRYDNLFQVLAGQSVVSVNDYWVQRVHMDPFYHVASKVKILGPKQQWLVNCYGNNENTTCTGDGSDHAIHDLYFTPRGQCGSADKGW